MTKPSFAAFSISVCLSILASAGLAVVVDHLLKGPLGVTGLGDRVDLFTALIAFALLSVYGVLRILRRTRAGSDAYVILIGGGLALQGFSKYWFVSEETLLKVLVRAGGLLALVGGVIFFMIFYKGGFDSDG